jgi:redox-sensitive bicupin YhaK (pirin superfamily)
MVGPFIFIDHMGPSEMHPGKYLDVDQHPHIGLSTLTYLLDGEIEHRDSLGSVQRITPGSVNLMTAGKGVTHTERIPEELREETFTINGYQIWLALPKDSEEMDPQFHHIESEKIPYWNISGVSFRLIVGEGFGKKSPVPVLSEMFMIEVRCDGAYDLDLTGQIKGEIGILVSEGSVETFGNKIEAGQMLVSKTEDTCSLKINDKSLVFLFGGEPFPEKRYIDWNFVSSDRDRLKEAREDWKNRRFPKVPGDDTYVPVPE